MDPLLSRIDTKRRQLFRQRPLPADAIARVKDELDLAWIHTCHSWGGGTMRRSEVSTVVCTGLAVADRPITEHLEVTNLAEALDWVEGWARSASPLRPRDVRELHAILQQGLPGSTPGRFRPNDVAWDGYASAVAAGPEVPRRVQELCSWINGREAKGRHAVVRAAYALSTLTAIMPFREGNDLVARLIMNGLLLQKAYPIALFDEPDHLRAALRRAQIGDMKGLIALVGESVELSLDQYLAAL